MLSLKTYIGVLFLLTLSGVMLILLYAPNEAPLRQVAVIEPSHKSAGYVFRGVHFWLAQAVIVLAITHFFRALFAKAYQPRTIFKTVSIGAIALLTLALGFTGYLLPWDSLVYWLGKLSVRSGFHWTLFRVYVLHVLFLPALTLAVLVGYVGRMRRDGMPSLLAISALSL